MKKTPEQDYASQFPKGKVPPILKKNPELRMAEELVLYDKKDETEKAKKLIGRISYITIASADKDGRPWNTPVFFACDKDYNFYWISSQDSVHSVNIKENANVAIVIYDSTVPEGSGFGVYFSAKAAAVEKKSEIERACKLLYTRKNKPIPLAEEFVGDAPQKVYKAVPITFWVNDLIVKNDRHKEVRIEIQLK